MNKPLFAPMTQRIVNAISGFKQNLIEFSGCTEQQAQAVTDAYLNAKLATLDPVGGVIRVKHGGLLDKETILTVIANLEKQP